MHIIPRPKLTSGKEKGIFLFMNFDQFTKDHKKPGRPSRKPVEKLQTIAWFYHLAKLLDVKISDKKPEQSFDMISDELKLNGYIGPKLKRAKKKKRNDGKKQNDLYAKNPEDISNTCKCWAKGSSSPTDSIKEICQVVDKITPGEGIKLWATFYYGIDGCYLWHKFDLYNEDPSYNLPRSILAPTSETLEMLATSTDNAIRFLCREAAMPIKTSLEISIELYIGGMIMATEKAAHELIKYGINPDLYRSVFNKQITYLHKSNPNKYRPAGVLLEGCEDNSEYPWL